MSELNGELWRDLYYASFDDLRLHVRHYPVADAKARPVVIDSAAVPLELMGDEVDLFTRGVGDVQPARVRPAKLGQLVRGPIDDPAVFFHEEASGHLPSLGH